MTYIYRGASIQAHLFKFYILFFLEDMPLRSMTHMEINSKGRNLKPPWPRWYQFLPQFSSGLFMAGYYFVHQEVRDPTKTFGAQANIACTKVHPAREQMRRWCRLVLKIEKSDDSPSRKAIQSNLFLRTYQKKIAQLKME